MGQLGFRIQVLSRSARPVPRRTRQENFLVVAGECVLVIEGEERHLKQWTRPLPTWTKHARRRRRRALRDRDGRQPSERLRGRLCGRRCGREARRERPGNASSRRGLRPFRPEERSAYQEDGCRESTFRRPSSRIPRWGLAQGEGWLGSTPAMCSGGGMTHSVSRPSSRGRRSPPRSASPSGCPARPAERHVHGESGQEEFLVLSGDRVPSSMARSRS